ncbi:MAG: hypothetical protein FJ125_07395 [Deltaproteobacteria bacterium]|nr:hypothetical protein [Deltaproteobacteria bacterium]
MDSAEWLLLEECATLGKVCEEGKCVGCEPGAKACRGQSVVQCQEDGKTELVMDICGEGAECREGACVAVCGRQGGKISYQGCEYWAVDLENADVEPGAGAISPASAQFAVAISNTDQRNPVHVQIFRLRQGREQLVIEKDIPPRQAGASGIEVFDLPPDNGVVGSSKGPKAFRVAASGPVIAYQFNPLNNTEEAFSNDASLLLPSNALDKEYLATTGDGIKLAKSMLEQVDAPSYVAVVGVTEEPARVTVNASNDIVAFQGPDVRVQGRTVTATLSRYDVLSVASRVPEPNFLDPTIPPGQANLSGTRISSDVPVAVFAGNTATIVPTGQGGSCCADHLEEQLFPISSWGRHFVAPRSMVRRVEGEDEPDYWRITAAQADTQVAYRPRRPQGAPQQLVAGQSVEFSSNESFVIEASKPVLVTQFLTSSGQAPLREANPMGMCQPGDAGDRQCTRDLGAMAVCWGEGMGQCYAISDPSMILIPPVEQFRDDYLFLSPRDYKLDFVNVMARAGTRVEIDGELIPENQASEVGELGGEDWVVYTHEVSDGSHCVTADTTFGLVVYGYDKDVSYGYPGGLNLERINQQ